MGAPRPISADIRSDFVEECWTLLGHRRGGIWLARRVRHGFGGPGSVEFDGNWVLAREERYGDVVGFFHTHPAGHLALSQRDVRTMRAWCSAFGKPLLCVIASDGRLAAYRFDDDESAGVPLDAVAIFPRGVVVAVDSRDVKFEGDGTDGRKAAARRAVPRRREARPPA